MHSLEPVVAKTTPVFITLGDSQTEIAANPFLMGYQTQLAFTYQRKADVVNRGRSSRTTRWWLDNLPSLLADWAQRPPSLITIYLGTNDACSPTGSLAEYHVPVDAFSANMRAIVGNFTAAFPQVKIILVTPGTVEEWSTWGESRNNKDIYKYVVATRTIAHDLGLALVDMWEVMDGAIDMTYDGLHLNNQAHDELHILLLEQIKKKYPELTTENMPWAF
ncbi:isoamyl acetate-hydrolyzing esterase [Achlya hypogyna]|uniref:Isoamyl acetate-hydrolyzing esterase n=1 Tax=Achlya hypogyna TaxID=1202772 RepID=A0A1V9ZGY4_ACHHY|nr:isoamyl acetate-hydrolyzing esterase [Achlya hypogyna]